MKHQFDDDLLRLARSVIDEHRDEPKRFTRKAIIAALYPMPFHLFDKLNTSLSIGGSPIWDYQEMNEYLTLYRKSSDNWLLIAVNLGRFDPAYFDELCAAAGRMLRHGLALPGLLIEFAGLVLSGDLVRPVVSRRDQEVFERPSYAVACAVATVAFIGGLNPTRNDESPSRSACDVVAEATCKSFAAVKKSYYEQKKYLPLLS